MNTVVQVLWEMLYNVIGGFMMKKIVSIFIIAVLLGVLVGCGGTTGETEYEDLDYDKILTDVQQMTDSDGNPIFGALTTDPQYSSIDGLTDDLVESSLVAKPMMNVQSSMFAIVKPVDGKYDEVKGIMEDFVKSYAENWSTYLPDQYELVQNYMLIDVEGQIVLIISSDNDAVLEMIKNGTVK